MEWLFPLSRGSLKNVHRVSMELVGFAVVKDDLSGMDAGPRFYLKQGM